MLTLLGNIIWLVFGGLWLGVAWLLVGCAFCCTVIGIPFGIASFRIARFAFFPFGKDIVRSGNAGVCTFVLNVVWFLFAGFWLAVAAVCEGVVWCCTIVGIPLGLACFKLAKVSLCPLGKEVV